jgi:hypothetical protein
MLDHWAEASHNVVKRLMQEHTIGAQVAVVVFVYKEKVEVLKHPRTGEEISVPVHKRPNRFCWYLVTTTATSFGGTEL